jgi:hypothetical protein
MINPPPPNAVKSLTTSRPSGRKATLAGSENSPPLDSVDCRPLAGSTAISAPSTPKASLSATTMVPEGRLVARV